MKAHLITIAIILVFCSFIIGIVYYPSILILGVLVALYGLIYPIVETELEWA